MNKVAHILTAKNAFAITLLLAALVLMLLAPKAAVNVDEQLHYPHAKQVVNWYFTGGADETCLNTPVTNLKYYGQSVDNITALVNRVFKIENEFLVRHFTGGAMFWFLLLFSGMIAKQLTGSFYVSVITVLTLLFMPRLFGQAFGNLKDIPFATGYAAGLYMIIQFFKEMPDPRWRTAVLLGLAIAFTVSVRVGGFILFAYLGLFMIFYLSWKPFELRQIVSTKPVFVRLLGQGVVIILIGYFAGLLFWPFALQNVFVHPFESLSVMEQYKVSIRQIFEGNLTWSTNLPWYYLPKWLLISTPLFVWLGSLVFSFLFIKHIFVDLQFNNAKFYELLILFGAVFPFLYVIAINANLYSGVRQMLFILPPIAILAAAGIYKIYKSEINKFPKYGLPLFFFVLMLLPIKHQAKTFPLDYIYFNKLAGGNQKAWSNYEYDYYFHGLKTPFDYLKELPIEVANPIVATNSNLYNYYNNSKLKYQYARYLERSSYEWDYAIFGINYVPPDLLRKDKWQSTSKIKTFYHKGNPVAVLLKRGDRNGLMGIRAMEEGDYEVAEKLLKKAVKNDPNNVWLFVNLSKVALLRNDTEQFERYIKEGRKIYQEYEPFYLLEAQRLYGNGNYKNAYLKIMELLEINPRYKNAQPLLLAIKKQLGIKT